jgi:hypothetical protein
MTDDLKSQAEALEDQARAAKKEKKYEESIALLKKAVHIYEDLGFKGQIGILEKEILRTESLMKFLGPTDKPGSTQASNQISSPDSSEKVAKMELDRQAGLLEAKAKKLAFDKHYDELIACYEDLAKIYEALGYEYQIRKVNFEIERYKNLQRQDQQDENSASTIKREQEISIAEERAQRLQMQKKVKEEQDLKVIQRLEQEEREKKAVQSQKQISIQDKMQRAKEDRMMIFQAKEAGVEVDAIQRQREERERKLRELEAKKAQEEAMLKEANAFLDEAKRYVDRKEYDTAKNFYERAAKAFEAIGWKQQAEMLLKEVKNVSVYKAEYEKKQEEERKRREAQQAEFEARAAKILAEKEAKRRAEEEERKKLPPELQQKVDRAQLVLEKAKELEEKGKFDKSLSRYEYLIELYQEIGIYGPEKFTPIKNKIEDLKKKMPPE